MEQIYTPFVRLPNIIMDLMITVFHAIGMFLFRTYGWYLHCKRLTVPVSSVFSG
jgi:hypothetical protein